MTMRREAARKIRNKNTHDDPNKRGELPGRDLGRVQGNDHRHDRGVDRQTAMQRMNGTRRHLPGCRQNGRHAPMLSTAKQITHMRAETPVQGS